MDLDNFEFPACGDVKVGFTWSPVITEFEFGNKQYNRTRIHAKKTYQFKVSGSKDLLYRLVDFYNNHHGKADPFLVTYDGVTEQCFFADALVFKFHRENKTIIGGEVEVGLEVDKQVTSYPTPNTSDMLPLSSGDVEYTLDWKTDIYTSSTTQRRVKNQFPSEKISVTMSGKKSVRDELLSLYNSHEMTPLKMKVDDVIYDVRFPTSLTITDKRENGNIIGFECKMEVEICNQMSM